MKNPLTGIILCGGKSTRMGTNKAFIQVEGVPLIKRIQTLFERLFDEVIIVTDRKDLFLYSGAKIYPDIIPGKGVLGGLYTGLSFSSFKFSFCVACDMPFLKEAVIEYLIKKIGDSDVVVPRTINGLEPLHGIYSKNCIRVIKQVMDSGVYRVAEIYHMVSVRVIDEKEFLFLDPARESFINVNTPEDLGVIGKRKRSA